MLKRVLPLCSSGSRGPGGHGHPLGPVKIRHKKDSCRIDFMFLAPLYPAAGSATALWLCLLSPLPIEFRFKFGQCSTPVIYHVYESRMIYVCRQLQAVQDEDRCRIGATSVCGNDPCLNYLYL